MWGWWGLTPRLKKLAPPCGISMVEREKMPWPHIGRCSWSRQGFARAAIARASLSQKYTAPVQWSATVDRGLEAWRQAPAYRWGLHRWGLQHDRPELTWSRRSVPLYFGRPISAPLPCPAQALTSPSLSLQEVRLIDRGEEQAAPPSRAWVCAPRAARARNSCQKSSTRWAHACAADQATFALRGARTTSPRRRR